MSVMRTRNNGKKEELILNLSLADVSYPKISRATQKVMTNHYNDSSYKKIDLIKEILHKLKIHITLRAINRIRHYVNKWIVTNASHENKENMDSKKGVLSEKVQGTTDVFLSASTNIEQKILDLSNKNTNIVCTILNQDQQEDQAKVSNHVEKQLDKNEAIYESSIVQSVVVQCAIEDDLKNKIPPVLLADCTTCSQSEVEDSAVPLIDLTSDGIQIKIEEDDEMFDINSVLSQEWGINDDSVPNMFQSNETSDTHQFCVPQPTWWYYNQYPFYGYPYSPYLCNNELCQYNYTDPNMYLYNFPSTNLNMQMAHLPNNRQQ